jgi:hypothetical protein
MSFALDSVGSPAPTRTTLLRHAATPASQAAALALAETMLPPIGVHTPDDCSRCGAFAGGWLERGCSAAFVCDACAEVAR